MEESKFVWVLETGQCYEGGSAIGVFDEETGKKNFYKQIELINQEMLERIKLSHKYDLEDLEENNQDLLDKYGIEFCEYLRRPLDIRMNDFVKVTVTESTDVKLFASNGFSYISLQRFEFNNVG